MNSSQPTPLPILSPCLTPTQPLVSQVNKTMQDIDARTTHTSISGTSLDQTVKTMVTSLTELTNVVASIQAQQQNYKETRRTRDRQTEDIRNAKEKDRDREKREAEADQKMENEQRHKQT